MKNINITKNSFILLFLLSLTIKANTDKYRLVLTGNPATTITIGWNQISGNNAKVYYGTEDFGKNTSLYKMTKAVDKTVIFRGMTNQFVSLKNLQPNTRYFFVIKDSEGVSNRFWFKTCPDDLSKLSFIAGGDSRNNRDVRQKANLLVSKLKPNAVFFGGDMTLSDNDDQWQKWFDDWQLTTASDGRMFPIVPTRGNHEREATIYKLFNIPNSKEYYALTFGNNLVRTYTLNTEIATNGDQKKWLENDLKQQKDIIWKTAQYHKPMRPHSSWKSEGNRVYDAWANIFYNEGFRLIVECDSHTSKTTWPIQPTATTGNVEGFIRNDNRGTVYAGEGSWGAPLRNNNDNKSWTRGSAKINQFKWVFVDENNIELRTIKVDNANNVAELSNETPFSIPKNLDVQSLNDGTKVVKITPLIKPNIVFNNTMPTFFANDTQIPIQVDVVNNTKVTIASVVIYDGNTKLTTLTQPPFSYTASLNNDSKHTLKAIATTNKGMQTTVTKDIFIGTISLTGENSIQSASDDVEESESGTIINFDSNGLEIGEDNPVIGTKMGNQKVGLRFVNVKIPRGAVIKSAYIQFTSNELKSTTHTMNVKIENTSNALPYKNEAKTVSSREFTSKTIHWKSEGWWTSGEQSQKQKTPDLATLLQDIINKSEWKPSNSISFVLTNKDKTSNNRSVLSFDGDKNKAPKLIYTYTFSSKNNSGNNTTWLGSNDANLLNTANWTNGIPTENTNIIIPDIAMNTLTINSPLKSKSISIETGSKIVIKPKGGIIVDKIIGSENVIIESSENNNGYLIAKSTEKTGTVTYKRYLSSNWHLVGSPVSIQKINQFANSGNLVENPKDKDLLALGKYISTNEKGNRWSYYRKNSDWGNFKVGKGYIMKQKNAGTSVFKGTIITGDIIFKSSGNTKNTFELLSNPYTAFLNLNNATNSFININANNLSPTGTCVYLWDAKTTNYFVVNKSSKPVLLPPGQGFFIKAKKPNQLLNLRTSMVSKGNTSNLFYRTEPSTKITATILDNTTQKNTIIKFLDNTSGKLDIGYDAEIFNDKSENLTIFTKLIDGSYADVNFMLQCINSNSVKKTKIPLFIYSNANKTVRFFINKTNFPKKVDVFLDNLDKNTSFLLNDNQKYSINLKGKTLNRFKLRLAEKNTLFIKNKVANDKKEISISAYHKILTIKGVTKKASVYVFNLLGIKILEKEIYKTSKIELFNMPLGVYFVTVKEGNHTLTKKILLKR